MGDPFDEPDDEGGVLGFLDDLGQDGAGADGGGVRPGVGSLPGLSPFERAVVDRVERERDAKAGRMEFGRYARAHPSDVRARGAGGLDDGQVVDALYDAAERFEPLVDRPSELEREAIESIITASRSHAVKRPKPDPNLATFIATIPDGGIKTNRTNEWVLTLHVAWENREEISRLIDTIPMQLLVKVEKINDA